MNTRITYGGIVAVALSASLLSAADHGDGPTASQDPTADVGDVYAWMSADMSKMNLIMTLGKDVSRTMMFSDQVQYAFRTTSQATFTSGGGFDLDIICQFDADQTIYCWAGDDAFVTGDASVSGGVTATGMQVFAGVRDDPFFFNLSGFRSTTSAVANAASSLTFDDAGCPALDAATASFLVEQLTLEPDGSPAVDDFAMQNVLALVVQVDAAIVTKGGPVVGVWGSTHRR